jgi:carbonic anhydrase/acetyltransferase-like protein (isoleucine patch superfamily)
VLCQTTRHQKRHVSGDPAAVKESCDAGHEPGRGPFAPERELETRPAAAQSRRVSAVTVFVVTRGGVIAPFGVAADGCPIGDRTLAEVRDDTLRRCGLAPPTTKVADDVAVIGPALVLADDVWVSRRALAAFLGGAIYGCAFVPAGVTTTAREALDAAAPLSIPMRVIPTAVPVPRTLLGVPSGQMMWPLTSTVVMRLRHWVHVLRASHVVPQVWLLEQALRDPVRSLWRGLLGLRPTAAAREAAWKRRFVFVGRRCQIHPSALIEGSVIGDDVVIGPGAVVLHSVIGSGSRLEQRTHVSQCTLGRRTFMSLNSSMQACVTFDDADACANNLQACVVGARAGLTSFARALDTTLFEDGRPGAPVQVMDGGQRRPTGELPCGACFGPDSYVGAGATIAAGRMIGAGVRIVGEGLVTRTATTGPGTYRVVDGGLVPLRADGS